MRNDDGENANRSQAIDIWTISEQPPGVIVFRCRGHLSRPADFTGGFS
jgi:hypothetical protein